MADPVLRLAGLHAGYGDSTVVRELDLVVEAGQVVALLGPNGAGKTTTLLTISGLLPSLGGVVEVLGAPPNTRAPHRMAHRGLAHVPEDRALFSSLTVVENLRVASAGIDMKRLLGYFPALEPLLDRPAGLLSGGEQQMLALGRAFAVLPRLLLVDEMSLGLAPVIVEQLLPALRQLADDTGAGVLLVEQHVGLALEVADRGSVLSHGDVVAEGSSDELLENRTLVESGYFG